MAVMGMFNSNITNFHIYHNHDDYVELMPSWGYAVSAFILFIIGFFGFFLNLIVIVLMCKDRQLWTPLNLILFNLVCSDFSVSILGNPFTLISALSHRWVFGKSMCVLYGFFMTLLGITSITTLTVLSFERFMMVSRPFVAGHLTMRGACVSIFFIWCYSFAVTTPPLYGWGSYVNEAANISCSINWEEQTLNAQTYIMFLFATGLILPVIIISYSYLNILKIMKRNATRMGRVTKAESRVTTMVFIMILTFMVAWTPYSIFALIEQFAPYDIVSPGMGVIPALVAKSSICYDPIIYVGMNTQFRGSLMKMFGIRDKGDSLHEKALENTLMSPTKGVSNGNETNVDLQYLNPQNNQLVTVTIYQEEDDEENKKSPEKKIEGKVRFNVERKKKITLITNSFEDESSGLSADTCIKETSDSNKSNNFYTDHVFGHLNDSGVSDMTSKTDLHSEDNYNSNVLLFGKKSQSETTQKSSFGIDNFSTDIWEDKESSLRNNECRRKSLIQQSRSDVEPKILKNAYSRRKSTAGAILSGHTRKFSAAFQDGRSSMVTRLMVDEREMSKLMYFEDGKYANASKHSLSVANEEMM